MKKLTLLLLCVFVASIISTTYANVDTDPNTVTSNISMNIMVLDQGNYRLSWSVREDIITIQAMAKTKGWLAIGFEPSEKMKDADMILGYLDPSGTSKVIDAFSVGLKGPHPDDVSLGGTNDLLSSSVTQQNGWTTLSFERKLMTGDKFDKEIPQNKSIKVIWSYGTTTDIKTYHETSRGISEINFTAGSAMPVEDLGKKQELIKQPEKKEKKPIDFKTFLLMHILLMSFMFLSMLAAVSMIYVFKKKTAWFKIHKSLLYVTMVTFIGGFLSAILLVNSLGSSHFRGSHKIIGLLILIISFGFLLLSINHPWKEKQRSLFRNSHIWIARTLITLILVNLYLGIILARQLLGK